MDAIEINDIRDVGKILDFVHDRKFDIEDIVYDEGIGELTLSVPVISDDIVEERRIFFLRRWKNPIYSARLIFRHVIEFKVSDRDALGEGLINRIDYDNGVVRIVCSNPVLLEAKTRDLSISLVPGAKVVGHVRRIGLN